MGLRFVFGFFLFLSLVRSSVDAQQNSASSDSDSNNFAHYGLEDVDPDVLIDETVAALRRTSFSERAADLLAREFWINTELRRWPPLLFAQQLRKVNQRVNHGDGGALFDLLGLNDRIIAAGYKTCLRVVFYRRFLASIPLYDSELISFTSEYLVEQGWGTLRTATVFAREFWLEQTSSVDEWTFMANIHRRIRRTTAADVQLQESGIREYPDHYLQQGRNLCIQAVAHLRAKYQ